MESFIPMPSQHDIIPKTAQSKVRLYSGVPWDNSYDHVRLYGSQSALLTALETWRVHPSNDSKLSFTTPIRVGSLEVRLPFTEMEGLEINYLAFQNTGISDTWVFCFVTNIEWLSWNTTQINFELDIWQNNIYKATLKPCFIERSHILKSQDTMFANLLPENFETGEYIQYDQTNTSHGALNLCLYVSEKRTETEWEAVQGGTSNNVYMAADLISYPLSSSSLETDMTTLLNNYTDAGKVDAILDMFIAPQECVDQWSIDTYPQTKSYTLEIGSPFEGYVPKNNKLYQYPYICIAGLNNLGESQVYRWEYFQDAQNDGAVFQTLALMATSPTITLTPYLYKGATNNWAESLIYNNFPTCAWASDTYRAWAAQNKGTVILSAVNATMDVVNAGASLTSGVLGLINPFDASETNITAGLNEMQSAVNQIGGLLNTMYQHAIMPPTVHGKVMQEATNAAFNLMCFTLKSMTITKDFAQAIDDYWTAFGYPIRHIETPNMNTRSAWNYIKTVGCNIQGDIDLAQRSALRNIFDRGVTIWHTDDVGNYSLANN